MWLGKEMAMRPYFTCSDSMYLVRLLMRIVTMPGGELPTDDKIGPQTGISFDPCTF
jgi:hypothetical protein